MKLRTPISGGFPWLGAREEGIKTYILPPKINYSLNMSSMMDLYYMTNPRKGNYLTPCTIYSLCVSVWEIFCSSLNLTVPIVKIRDLIHEK